MHPYLFAPVSLTFVKNKARQLQRAFPGMRLSCAQEATAAALGYPNFYDCRKRCTQNQPAPECNWDETLGERDRWLRRHQQFCALVDVGRLPAGGAEWFVRCWGLTSKHPAKPLQQYEHPYLALEIGRVKANSELEDGWERPRTIADGIRWGNLGSKHQYYTLNQSRFAKLPAYMRGYSCTFLDFEDGKALPLFFEDAEGSCEKGLEYLWKWQPLLYQWLHWDENISMIEKRGAFSLKELYKETQVHPEDWFALSYRMVYDDNDVFSQQNYLPCLRGSDYAAFLESKGELEVKKVQWFKIGASEAMSMVTSPFSESPGRRLRWNANEITPCDPVYHYPFKHGPMAWIEFEQTTEGGGMMLRDEVEWEAAG